MEFFTTKIKVIVLLFLIICITGVVAAAVAHRKTRKKDAGPNGKTYQFPVHDLHERQLANGMHVLVYRCSTMPKVLLQIAYDVGSADETSGERGLAHLIEHMIFKGTEQLSENDIEAISRKYGATFNAFTANDMTSYYFETNKDNWRPLVPVLADCMQNARFEEQHLSSELKTVIQELKMIKDDFWRSMIYKTFELLFPPFHPYHCPVPGYKEDLLKLNANDLHDFYQKHYQPSRATLFVVGDVDVEETFALIQKNFESIPATTQKDEKKVFPASLAELVNNNVVFYEEVASPRVALCWRIPGLKDNDEIIASAIEYLLSGGQSGRLYRLLVDEKKVAASVDVSALKLMEAGIFFIVIEPLEGQTDTCVNLIKSELEKLGQEGVTAEDLERIAKNKMMSFFVKMRNFKSFCNSWITSYFATRKIDHVFKRFDMYSTLTSDDLKNYAARYLDPFLMHTVQVLPLPEQQRERKKEIKLASDKLDQTILEKRIRTTAVEEARFANKLIDPQTFSFSFPKPERVVHLANGLKVLLLVRKETPLVSLYCHFKEAEFYGEAREGIGIDIMMDMLMEQSVKYSKVDNVDYFERRGAHYSFNAHGVGFVCMNDDFEKIAQRCFHIIRYPLFPADALDKIKNIVVDKLQRDLEEPNMIASRLLKNKMYQGHPFSWTFQEAIDDVKSLTVKKVKKIHETYLCPAQMEMAVVGNFDIDAMVSALESVFGAWPAGDVVVPEQEMASYQQESIDHPMLRDQIVFAMGQPSPLTINHPDIIPLKLLNIICFGSMGSRIYNLRERTGLFYLAGGAIAANAGKQHGYDVVKMIVGPDRVEEAEAAIKHLFDGIARDGFTQTELKDAQQIYLKALIDGIASDMEIAKTFCHLDCLNLGFDYYDKVLNVIQSLTVQDLNALAKKYCTYEHMTRVRVGAVQKDEISEDESEQ